MASTVCAKAEKPPYYLDTLEHYPSRIYAGPTWNYSTVEADRMTTATGSSWGGVLGYEHKAPFQFYKNLYATWEAGRFSTESYPQRKIWSHVWKIEALIGYTLAFGEEEWLGITPFIGYRYQKVYNSTTLSQLDAYYKAIAYTSSLPMGMVFDIQVKPFFTLGFMFTAYPQFGARAQATDVHSAEAIVGSQVPQHDEDIKMSNMTSWEFAIPFRFNFLKRVEIDWLLTYGIGRDPANAAVAAFRVLGRPTKVVSFGSYATLGVRF